MKLSYAKQLQIDIDKAADHLNRLIQEASVEGFIIEFETLPFRHVSGLVFDVVTPICKVRPSDLDAD